MTVVAKGKRKDLRTAWDDAFYVRTYELRRSGISSKSNVAAALGVSRETLKRWLDLKPALKDAWERGGSCSDNDITLEGFVFKRLSPKMQQLWRDINRCDDSPHGTLRLAEIMSGQTKKARQRIFLYALVRSNFNTTEGLRRCGIPRRTLRTWVIGDPDFAEMLGEIDQAKKDMFENSLIDLVQARDTSATIFVNKTYNKDRGYGESKRLEVSGMVEHQHTLVSMEDLALPLEVRQEILEAFKVKKLQENVVEAVDVKLLGTRVSRD